MTRSQYLPLPAEIRSQTSAASRPPTSTQTPLRGNTPLRHETTSQALGNQNPQSQRNPPLHSTSACGDLDETSRLSDEEQLNDMPGVTDGDVGWDPSTFLDGVASYMHLSDEDREELYAFTKVSSHPVYGKEYSQIYQCSLDTVSQNQT